MASDMSKLEDVRQTVFALLLPYKNGCTPRQLSQDYHACREEDIPYQELGYGSLLNLLRSMPDIVHIEFNNGKYIVKHVPSPDSAHVTALVAGQNTKKCKTGRKQYRPCRFYPNVPVPRVQIPIEVLSTVIEVVYKHPRGISKIDILQLIHSKMPHTYIPMQSLDEQLRELTHRIRIHGNMIYPLKEEAKQTSKPGPSSETQSQSNSVKICVSGCEDPEELCNFIDDHDIEFLPAGCTQSSGPKRANGSIKKPISRFIQDSLSNCTEPVVDDMIKNTAEQKEDMKDINYNMGQQNSDSLLGPINDFERDKSNYLNNNDVDLIISDRVKFRLEKLIQKYPGGIPCAQLPDKYYEEYKMNLQYMELGFSSVREFASHLPNIFHCVPLSDTGDYVLYFAKSEIPTQANKKPKVPILQDLYLMETNVTGDEFVVLPPMASIDTCKELIPDNVLTIGECVALIKVENLVNMDKPYIEVVVVEVFTPTFFWVQLRKKMKLFKTFMDDLHQFYEKESKNYIIPSVVLEKGLNCACPYNGVWHRGIIKAVNPDLQVTVFFYDYGTLKTYSAAEIRYLHRSFSNLPAQAIPCGLVNIKPCAGTRWTRSVTHEFALKTSQIPLIATIASINEEDNSMMITLTDTSEEEDLHINDWMVEKKLALHGKMVCMKRRNFLFAYLQSRGNLTNLNSQYTKTNQDVTNNNYEKHKHVLAVPGSCERKNCFNSDKSSNDGTMFSSSPLKSLLPTISNKSRIYTSDADTSMTSEINKGIISCRTNMKGMTLNENSRYHSSGSSINSNSDLLQKRRGRYEKIVGLMEVREKSKRSSSSQSTGSVEKSNLLYQSLSDMDGSHSINNESKLENNEQPDPIQLKNSFSNDNQNEINSFWPKLSMTNFDDDEDYTIVCYGTCGGTCKKGHRIEPVNWAELLEGARENTTTKYVPSAAVNTLKKMKDKHTLPKERQRSMTTEDNYFLQAIGSSSHVVANGGNICWTTSGNISNCAHEESTILKRIKNVIHNREDNYIAISEEMFERLSTTASPHNTSSSESSSSETTNNCDASKESSSIEGVLPLKEVKEAPEVNLHTNYFMNLQANTARSRILQMLMKRQNFLEQSDNLDSDDNSVSDHGEVSNEPATVQLQTQECLHEILDDIAEKISENSEEEVFEDECDKQSHTTSDQTVQTSIDSKLETEVDEIINEEILSDELKSIRDIPPEVTEIKQSTVSVLPSDIPVFNDLDADSDSEEFDVHGDCVEVTDLLIYVEENLLFKPQQCYEDENALSKQEKKFKDESLNEPLILPKSTLIDKPIAPPPGFPIPGKPLTLETIMEELVQSSSLNGMESNKAPTVNSGGSKNPFSEEMGQSSSAPKFTPQKLVELYSVNLQLQMHIADTLKTLLSKLANDPQNARDAYKVTLEALLKNAQLQSFIGLVPPNVDNNLPNEKSAVYDRNGANSLPTDYAHVGTSNNPTVPNGTPLHFSAATANSSNVNSPFSVPPNTHSYYEQGSQNLPFHSGANNYNSQNNHFNGTSTIPNIYEQHKIPGSMNNGIRSTTEAMHKLNDHFNTLSVTDNLTSTYFTPPVVNYSNYSTPNGVQPQQASPFREIPKVNMSAYSPAYQNNSMNNSANNYEPLNNNVIDRKETNPFKLSLAGKLRIPETNEGGTTTFGGSYNDASKANQYHPTVYNCGVPHATVNNHANVPMDQYSYQPRPVQEPLLKLSNSSLYSTSHLHNPSTAIPNAEALYHPNGGDITTNIWSMGNNANGHAFTGFIGANPLYYNASQDTSTRPNEVTPGMRTSNIHTRNDINNHHQNQSTFQEATYRLPPDCSNIFGNDMNAAGQQVNFDSSRSFEVPHMHSDRTFVQTHSMQNGFHGNIQVPNHNIGRPSNGLLDENYHHSKSNEAPSWSPITGFTSPLLMENPDEGYQTRPSTSNTLQNSPPLLQTCTKEEFHTEFSINGVSENPRIDLLTNRIGSSEAKKTESNNTENGDKKVFNNCSQSMCQNSVTTENLIDLESASSRDDSDDNKILVKRIKIYNCGSDLLCRQVELQNRFVHIFHYRGDGWILTADFVDTFTDFKSATYMISLFHLLDLNIEYLQIDKYDFSKIPELNSKIHKMSRDGSGMSYTRVHLLPLKNTIKVLTKLSIVSKDEIQKAIVSKEFVAGSVTHQLWKVITAYGEFLRVIEGGEDAEWL